MDKIKEFILGWTTNAIFNYEDIIKIGKKYYLLNSNLKKEIENIKLEPYSAGLFLGEFNKEFKPSLALIELIYPNTDKRIIVDDKVAWLFGCGRDIFVDNVIKESNSDKEVIVLNSKGDVFGYARKIKKDRKLIYKNILDIGDYLRREKR